MADMKEKLVELIRDGRFKAEAICNENNDCQTCTISDPDGYCKYGCIADHLIANGVTVQDVTDINVGHKWFSVKERLPHKDAIVMTWSEETRDMELASKLEYFEEDDVTHWMPLPEPPKGE